MKVYVVTSGSYSDYGIHEVFSTEEEAKKYIDAVGKTIRFFKRKTILTETQLSKDSVNSIHVGNVEAKQDRLVAVPFG